MNTDKRRTLVLVILDGWGAAPNIEGNTFASAHTPYYDEIRANYPGTTIAASGSRVGLPPSESGNAEVGHLNIGAGRVVETVASSVRRSISTGEFFDNPVLKSAFEKAAAARSVVHLIGMLSDSDIHSSPEVLYALLRMAKRTGLNEVYVHGILDGRDVSPRTADIYVEALEIKMADIGIGAIATLCGRFYAMDIAESWDRTVRAFTMLVHAEGERGLDAGSAIRGSFLRGIADEFIAPIVIEKEPGVPVATVKKGDTVVFFNHRADAMRQLCRSLAVPDAGSPKPTLDVVCLTEYDRGFALPVAFEPAATRNSLADVLEDNGIPNYRITESERYPHVTHFLNGGTSQEKYHQRNIIVADSARSNREAEPEAQSFKVTDAVLRGIEADKDAVFVVNLPATDLMAETGNLEKTIESIQFVDTCLGGVIARVRQENGIAIVTSSHGNAEEMLDPVTGEISPISTNNPVPFHIVDDTAVGITLRNDGSLEDIAPTILALLGFKTPEEMTGRDLRIS